MPRKKNTSGLVLFAICLAIALFIWLASNFSKVYRQVYEFPVEFITEGPGYTVNANADTLKAVLKASGWQLLYKKFKGHTLSYTVNENIEGLQKLSSKSLLAKRIDKEVIVSIDPETLTLEVLPLEGKMVPVAVDYTLDLPKRFDLVRIESITPDSVFIAGSDANLLNIDSISTKTVEINQKDDDDYQIELVIPDGIKMQTKQVQITTNIDEFTEQTFSVPIHLLNVPDDLDYMIYPQEVTISFLVPFEQYDNAVADNFEVALDFESFPSIQSMEVELSLKKIPSYAKNVQINPDVVNLIVYQ